MMCCALYHDVLCLKALVACRFGDNAPGAEGFCKYVRARQEGAILTLLRHKQTNRVILAGELVIICPMCWLACGTASAVTLVHKRGGLAFT